MYISLTNNNLKIIKMNNRIIINIFSVLLFLFVGIKVKAQTESSERTLRDLSSLNMADGVNIHIISPEPIQFVDLSSNHLVGDLPSENIARIKIITEPPIQDSISTKKAIKTRKNLPFRIGEDIGIITIVGQSFMAQYRVNFSDKNSPNTQANIHIQAEDMQPLEYPNISFSKMELRKFCLNISNKIDSEKDSIRKVDALKMSLQLNNVYVIDDYIFLDISMKNSSNLGYSIDGLHFSIEDKKIHKSTNNQSIDLKPVYQLHNDKDFKKNFRNVYVFKKFTYPNSKVLKIRFFEEQISGRTIELKIKYSDVLNADTF